MDPKSNKLKGDVNSAIGKAKQAAGRVFDDKKLEAKGMAQEGKGHVQQASGAIKEQIQKGSKAVGAAVEKVTDKIQGK